jgi:hypothetical protein
MKSPLLLAALLLVAPAAASAQNSSLAGSDDPNMSGATRRMFIINATTPGALTFSGAGTATFNNAVGTNNQFNVGSTTSIGVEASVSATQEFDGLASGVMQMGAGSNLMQTNGTSTAAASTQAAAVAANAVATEVAETISHDTGWEKATLALEGAGSSFFYAEITGNYGTFNDDGEYEFNDAYYDREWDELTAAEKNNLQTESDYTAWDDIPTFASFGFTGSMVSSTSSSSSRNSPQTIWSFQQQDFEKFKNAYNTESYKAYDSAYQEAFNTVIAKSSLNMSESTETGQIKGTFKTDSDTVTSIGQSSQLDAIAASALTTANATGDSVGGTSWTAAFNTAYEAGYASSIGESKTNTNSEVEVVGLGAIASVNSDSNSMFTVNLDRLDAFKTVSAQENSSATANGAATSTLSTNSFATQNSQRTASAFMQAFAANDEVSSN